MKVPKTYKPGQVLENKRQWTDDDVVDAKAYYDEHRPGLWQQLCDVENTTRDFRGLDITHIAKALLSRLHPDINVVERGHLWLRLRMLMRDENSIR
jgi:hypothetical protein